MSRRFHKKLLLNRRSQQQLQGVGLAELGRGLDDINAARRFGLWHKKPGADVYLFALLNSATRLTALHYFSRLGLRPAADQIKLAGKSHGVPGLTGIYRLFPECYPSRELEQAKQQGETPSGKASRLQLLAELYLLECLSDNQAAQSFRSLFDDAELCEHFDYHALIAKLDSVMQPGLGAIRAEKKLSELLQSPAQAAPADLAGQIAYIVKHWASWLPTELIVELQVARAISLEENQPRLSGPGPAPMPRFGSEDGSDSPAAFSADIDWMSSAVLLAKSIYVWLDQLSSRYQRSITTLAEIPEEELARLAHWGFNAIWLIGIWERSSASRKIKQLCGNPEAEASAYALYAYRVATDLGGDGALAELEARCRRHGIRLACDVVPNHTGIDSEWVLQHPDWFLQAESPPYPDYRFNGPDLCHADGVSIRIEDGYWDHSDAAVVCEYHDQHTGRRRYIYHGNDGTHMPWNDTAQLNFLLPEVRQAMSDLIVNIARRFSMIRFDAAMTLARKHFRRLWFPPPGGSAGVPSRSAFWMSDADFAQAFPVEFWREVVDRINREVPDTLLIAEAFWLMESYFVRNLGMHRVYNSAFMNLLKREENAKYRKILKDILAYNPEIMKRYVNFMNNPDEATAVEQFGIGDKYFGVATLLATLPGLPMFGHGQIEGFREKYGMEYRRAYWSETPDSGFIAHHERQVFPLLRRRRSFAGVEHFSMYDFIADHGVDENVFAYSNGPPGQKLLVVYNNSLNATRGRLHHAAPKASAEKEGTAHAMPVLRQELGLNAELGQFCRFRTLQGDEHLLHIDQLVNGLEMHLNGYEHQVFLDFRMLDDRDGAWLALHQKLRGQTVDDLDRELLRLRHQPLWQALAGLLDPQRLHVLTGSLGAVPQPKPVRATIKRLLGELDALAAELRIAANLPSPQLPPGAPDSFVAKLPGWLAGIAKAEMPEQLLSDMWQGKRDRHGLGPALLSWLLLHDLGQQLGLENDGQCLDLLRRFGLDFAWRESASSPAQTTDVFLGMLLLQTTARPQHPATSDELFAELFTDPQNAGLLGINHHAGQSWFSREGLAALAGAVALQAALMHRASPSSIEEPDSMAALIAERLRERLARAAAVGYRLDKFLHLE